MAVTVETEAVVRVVLAVLDEPVLDAVLPVVVLIGLIALTIVLFGVDATNGPLQVALLLSASFAALMAFKNGYTAAAVGDAAIGGVSTALGAIFILLAVGALIGTWNMAGTIPTVVDYAIDLLKPSIFYFATAAICALVGMVTGSSWTTAGTLGVAFVATSNVLGLSEAAAAGAVICGAYFGDKMTPLSETTVLVPKLVGNLTVMEHIRNMFWTSGPALGISLVIFLFLGFSADQNAEITTQAARDALASAFDISVVNLLPLPITDGGHILYAVTGWRLSWHRAAAGWIAVETLIVLGFALRALLGS